MILFWILNKNENVLKMIFRYFLIIFNCVYREFGLSISKSKIVFGIYL